MLRKGRQGATGTQMFEDGRIVTKGLRENNLPEKSSFAERKATLILA